MPIALNINAKSEKTGKKNTKLSNKKNKNTVNQTVIKKVHITKHKKDILKAFIASFHKGGINGITEGKTEVLAEIIDSILSFDYHTSTGVKATKKESILRYLKRYEQDEEDDKFENK